MCVLFECVDPYYCLLHDSDPLCVEGGCFISGIPSEDLSSSMDELNRKISQRTIAPFQLINDTFYRRMKVLNGAFSILNKRNIAKHIQALHFSPINNAHKYKISKII